MQFTTDANIAQITSETIGNMKGMEGLEAPIRLKRRSGYAPAHRCKRNF